MPFPILPSNSASGYFLTKSLRFRSSASAYLNRTLGTPTNQKIWTWSSWIKRGTLDSSDAIFSTSDNYNTLRFSTGSFLIYGDAGGTMNIETTQVFRDPAAWYHFVIAFDSTQATASNRVKLYVNGTQVTAFVTATYPSLNATYGFNSAIAHAIGRRQSTSNLYLDGYLAEVNFIDGQALTPSSFGSTNASTGVWQPAKYTGTYGTNGFYLPFTNTTSTTTIGYDFSGNSNNWTSNNISLTTGSTYDSMTDVPTLTSATTANYCTFNPVLYNAGSVAWSDGNLLVSMTGSADRGNIGTMAVSSGKYYWELTITAFHASGDLTIGISKNTQTSNAFTSSNFVRFNTGNGWYYYGTQVASTATGTWALNDVIGVALDMTGNNIYIYQNNTLLTSLSGYIDLTVPHTLMVDPYYTGTSVALNCGQQGFKYTPPTGFVALNTFNLPTSTIVKGNTVMDVNLWTGNDPSTQTIVNTAGFKPDLVWAKARSNAYTHVLVDSVRGVSDSLFSNLTNAEVTEATRYVYAFNSNGFSVKEPTGTGSVNATNGTYVGWQWQAGQGSSSSNTSGSITSTVSVNASAGFSVLTWTGTGSTATIGHGLGIAPSMIIVKRRDAGGSGWSVYFTTLPAGYVLSLQSTNGQANSSGRFTTTLPTSSVFSVGTDSDLNGSGGTYVAYCWSQIAGFSAFGSYTGNGSSDGPFSYLGFRPKFIMVKRTDSTSSWFIFDSVRNTYNIVDLRLESNTSNSEAAVDTPFDFLSNGIKVRGTNAQLNASGGTYIYMAFAENPFKNSLAR
jgi:hypothetical protein